MSEGPEFSAMPPFDLVETQCSIQAHRGGACAVYKCDETAAGTYEHEGGPTLVEGYYVVDADDETVVTYTNEYLYALGVVDGYDRRKGKERDDG